MMNYENWTERDIDLQAKRLSRHDETYLWWSIDRSLCRLGRFMELHAPSSVIDSEKNLLRAKARALTIRKNRFSALVN